MMLIIAPGLYINQHSKFEFYLEIDDEKRSFGCIMANSICDSYYYNFYHDCCQYYFAYHSTHIRVRELKHSIQDKSNMRLLNL